MKSLNDLIWDEDSDLEEGKKDAVTKSGMNHTCLKNSCSVLSYECYIKGSFATFATCWG